MKSLLEKVERGFAEKNEKDEEHFWKKSRYWTPS